MRRNKQPQGEETRIGIRNPRDFLAGMIFLIFGVTAAFVARDYPLGSAASMGPGYFPYVLGVLLAVLGAVICARSLFLRGHGVEAVDLRPLILILGAVGAFAATIESAGIVVATALVIGIGAAASRESRLPEVAALAAFLLAVAVGVFAIALGLPFRILPF